MSDYQIIVNTIRTAAIAALTVDIESVPTQVGRFINGRLVDASQAFDGEYPLIANLPFIITNPVDDVKEASILMVFMMQDRPETTPAERETICALMDELVEDFWIELNKVKTIGLRGKRSEPQYQQFQGTLSGFGLEFIMSIKSSC